MESRPERKFKPQRLNYFTDSLAIYVADFPIYYIESISERHFIVAGGGGSSKTGVHNQINVFELVPTRESCAAELVTKYQTPEEIPDAIMAASLMKDLPIIDTRLVTAGTNATIYHVNFDQSKKSFFVTDYEILEDPGMKAEIKSIKYIPDKILAGGIDGFLTIWDVAGNDKSVVKQFKAHGKEIDEIDVDTENQQIATLSRGEGRLAIWNMSNFKLIKEFKKDVINKSTGSNSLGPSYSYRSCRYACDKTSSDKSRSNHDSFLLIVCNPIPAKSSSLLYKWSTNDFKQVACKSLRTEGVMAMSVSLDGKFVAIGTRSGGVSIFEVKKLKQIYNIEGAHHNAVTNIEFLDPKPESLSLTNSKKCPLLSVSIDRRIVLHRPKNRSLFVTCCKTLIIVFMIYFIFFNIVYDYVTVR